MTCGDLAAAESIMMQLLRSTAHENNTIGVRYRNRGVQAHFNLALITVIKIASPRRKRSFAKQSRQSDFAEAWIGLRELYRAQGKWKELNNIVQRLATDQKHFIDGCCT